MSRGKVVWKFCVWPLCLCLLWGLLCLPSPVEAAEGTVTVDSWAALKAAVVTGTATNIVVSGINLMADEIIIVGQNRTVAISAAQGAGPLVRAQGFTDNLFWVQAGGDLTLNNIILDGNGEKVQSTEPLIGVHGKFTLGSGGKLCNNACRLYGGAVYVSPQGSFTMTGGEISGNSAGMGGGGVSIGTGGSFTMTGGQIYGNTTNGQGGGVETAGEFIMTGGDVSGNRAYMGGGVYQTGGTFTLKGGRIQNNLANLFGGVFVSGARFNLEGGTISGNQVPNGVGAGVYVDYNAGAVKVQGKPQLGLHDGDNGLYLAWDKPVSIGPNGLAEGGRINLEGAFDVADARVVAVKDAGTATSQEAARFHCQFDGYTVHPEAAGSPNYVLRAPRTVTASAGDHGTITPAGDVQVPYGGSQSFTFTPESGYVVDTVLVDGKPVAHTGNRVTLSNVTASLTLHVTFARGIVVPANEAGVRKREPAPEQTPGGGELPEQGLGQYQTAAALHLRTGPGTSYPKLGQLTAGQTVEVLGIQDGWAKIVYAGGADGYAYVWAQSLYPATEQAAFARVLARTLHVRAGAGTDYAIVGKLRRGAQVEVLQTVAGGAWLRIRYADGADGTAYICAQYAAQ